MAFDPWDTLRAGRYEAGVREMREAFVKKPYGAWAMELGVAYLWSGAYADASAHFQEAIEVSPTSNSAHFGMAGVAEWCLGNKVEAVGFWRAGLECHFADMAGGVRLPLLLFAASVLQPTTFSHNEAVRVLERRVADPRAAHWPGPLGAFVLGQIGEEQLRVRCRCTIGGKTEVSTALYHWLSDFYVGLKSLEQGNKIEFADRMERAAAVSWGDFDANRDLFLSKLWSEELYLARYASEPHRR